MHLATWKFLLWIPFLISAEIVVEIVPANAKNPEALVRGSDRGKTNSTDVEAFHLTTVEVRENLKRLGWRGIGNIIINQASAYGYRDLHVTLKPKRARIVQNNERVFSSANNEINYVEKNNGYLEVQVNATVRIKWYENKNISIGHNIKHVLTFNRLEHVAVYGENGFASIDFPVMVRTKEEIDLGHDKKVAPRLEVLETTLEVRVDYELSLDGDIYFEHYCIPKVKYCFKGSKIDVREYFKQLNYSPVLESYEVATFTYCHDPKVE